MTTDDQRIVREARLAAARRAEGYREQALRLYPWVCGGCGRTFTHANLRQLEVHHKNGNHHDNPTDGSNWELLCTYCHEHEHAKLADSAGRADARDRPAASTFQPFAGLKSMVSRRDADSDESKK
ncbi:MAG: YajD family HNH nuclease [Burkholderiaceae bacterium]